MARKVSHEEAIRKLLSIIGDESDDGLDTDDSSNDPAYQLGSPSSDEDEDVWSDNIVATVEPISGQIPGQSVIIISENYSKPTVSSVTTNYKSVKNLRNIICNQKNLVKTEEETKFKGSISIPTDTDQLEIPYQFFAFFSELWIKYEKRLVDSVHKFIQISHLT